MEIVNKKDSDNLIPDYKKQYYSKNNTITKLMQLNPGVDKRILQNVNADSITAGSNLKVLWTCPDCKEDYPQIIKSRIESPHRSSCPECWEKGTSDAEKSIALYLRDIVEENQENPIFNNTAVYGRVKNILKNKNREVDILIKNIDEHDWAIEYDGAQWHRNIDKDLSKDEMCLEADINLIRLRESTCPEYKSLPNVTFIYNVDKKKPEQTCKEILSIILGDTSDIIFPKFNTDYINKFTKSKIGMVTNNIEQSLGFRFPELADSYTEAKLKFARYSLNTIDASHLYADCNSRYSWFKCKTCGEIFLCTPKYAQKWDCKDCRFHGDRLIYVEDVDEEDLTQFVGNIIHKNDLVEKIELTKNEARKIEDPSKYGIEYRNATSNEIDLYNKEYYQYYIEQVKKSSLT